MVDNWKMQFPIKIKALREVPKQAHLRMKNVFGRETLNLNN